jgi:hypothetical protein
MGGCFSRNKSRKIIPDSKIKELNQRRVKIILEYNNLKKELSNTNTYIITIDFINNLKLIKSQVNILLNDLESNNYNKKIWTEYFMEMDIAIKKDICKRFYNGQIRFDVRALKTHDFFENIIKGRIVLDNNHPKSDLF